MMLGLMSLSFLALNINAYANPASASGDYGLSCTNKAYGVHHGGAYLEESAVEVNSDYRYGIYAGLNCAYSGAGRTNSSAIVGGEIARAAANAVIGAVSQRLSTAMNMDSNTAANMSYTTNGNGVGMAANHIIGGMNVWTNFSNSSFENDQTYTGVQLDSNQYDASSSAVTLGLDKKIGNIVIGLAYTGFDSDIDTKVNGGNIKTEGQTVGLYVGFNTGPLMISAGAGQGEYEIDTTRQDLGSLKTIAANDVTADVTYYHVNLSGTVNRGRMSFTPRLAYRNFDMDMPAFTDIVPDDDNTMTDNSGTTINANSSGATENESVGGKTYSSDMTEAGLSIALAAGGKLTPYIDVAYVNEDTTSASYLTERTTDAAAELNPSAGDGYISYGGGFILNLSSKLNGFVSLTETTNREDFSETTVSGSLRLKF